MGKFNYNKEPKISKQSPNICWRFVDEAAGGLQMKQ